MSKKKKNTTTYPKIGELMVCEELVVIVTGYGNTNIGYPCFAGVVIVEGKEWPIGFYSRTWTLDSFKKLDCKISLLPMVEKPYELA